MTDRIFNGIAIVALMALAFLAGSYAMLAKQFPYQGLHDAYRAAKALIDQHRELGSAHTTNLWQPARTAQRGVTMAQRDRAQPGYTLYTSGHMQAAYLIDLDGRQVHQWKMPYSAVWDESAAPRQPVPDERTYFRKVHLYPNGDLLAIYDGIGDTPHGYGLIKIDKDSRVIWKYLDHVHHDLAVAPDGRIFVLTHEITHDPIPERESLPPPRIDDFIVELSPDGQPLRKLRLIDALRQGDFMRLLDALPGYLAESGDYLHTNDVEFVDAETAAKFPFLRAGQLVLSMREPGALVALDMDSGTITWGIRGPWVGQHDPDLLANGHILLFDNNGQYEGMHKGSGRSQVIEFDPQTGGVVWRYGGSADHPLESVIRSCQQRLANGNTLITESDGGRLLEVDSAGDIVWEFVNPVRAGEADRLIPVVSSAQRVTPEALDPDFRQQLEAEERSTS
ncbi:MAG TPA: arylsulfotransferase family protein [Fontimonas sp.]